MADAKMPWKGIAKVTGAVAGAVGSLATLICWAEVRAERERQAEEARPRWTDKNRWERD